MAKLVSKVYGEALFEAAVDHGNAIQLMNETAQLEKILEDNPDFDKLMKHAKIQAAVAGAVFSIIHNFTGSIFAGICRKHDDQEKLEQA